MTQQYDVVSLDVWDTVLRRRCHPDEVKFHTARHLQLHHGRRLRTGVDLRALFAARCGAEGAVGTAWKQQGFDDEYALHEVYARWLAEVLRDQPPPGLVQELEGIELAYERWAVSLDPGIAALIAPHREARLVLVSDFYMDGRTLERLVRGAGFSARLDAVYASCDHRLNKRSGRLFEKVRTELDVAPDRWLHIGDNPVSDVEVPRRLGIVAHHYRNPPAEAQVRLSRARFARRGVESLWDETCRHAPPPPLRSSAAEQRLYALGQTHALGFVAFVYALLEDAVANGHERLFYFTREGVFFQRIHRALQAHRALPGPLPEGDLLEVSRVATFAASLRSPDLDELMRVWSQYSTQSVAALLRTLDLDLQDYRLLLARYAIDPGRPITYPWQDPSVRALFADRELVTRLAGDLDVKRTRLLDYLQQHGITRSTRRVAVVDIGWRGTIQDNLAHLLPDTRFTGYYLALYGFLNAQPPNTTKRGVYQDANQGSAATVAFEYPSVVEMLCNSASGSVLRYDRCSDGVRAVVEHEPAEDRVWHASIRHFQDGVLSMVPVLCERLRVHHLEAADLLAEGRRQLTRLVATAPRPLAQAYFRLKHNESFGLGQFVSKRADFPAYSFLRGITNHHHRNEFVQRIERSGWPQGLLRQRGFQWLVSRYNERVLGLDASGKVNRS